MLRSGALCMAECSVSLLIYGFLSCWPMPQGKNAIFGRNIIQFYYNSPIYAALAGRTGREDAAAGILGLNIEMLLI